MRTPADKLGGLDIIVNNAGYTWDTVIQKMTVPEALREICSAVRGLSPPQ